MRTRAGLRIGPFITASNAGHAGRGRCKAVASHSFVLCMIFIHMLLSQSQNSSGANKHASRHSIFSSGEIMVPHIWLRRPLSGLD